MVSYPPVRVREVFRVQPKIEALAVVRGEHVCDNTDVVRNAALVAVAIVAVTL